jgi:hypothetical protein
MRVVIYMLSDAVGSFAIECYVYADARCSQTISRPPEITGELGDCAMRIATRACAVLLSMTNTASLKFAQCAGRVLVRILSILVTGLCAEPDSGGTA